MLNIILQLEKEDSYIDIIKYIKHINNINKDLININIYIINIYSNNIAINYNIFTSIKKLSKKINSFIYTYNTRYSDTLYNDIIKQVKYKYILFTKLNIYLTHEFIDWISLNTINENVFIRSNIFKLNNISTKFNELYDNDIYYDIIPNLEYIINEYGEKKINSEEFINEFNNNNNIITYNNNNLKENSIYYINNSNDFLLISKNKIEKLGFNIDNNNNIFTFQYVILNLIKNNLDMSILPYKISAYKLNNINSNLDLSILNLSEEKELNFICNNSYNEHINYKIYDILKSQTYSYIRNQIKSYRGYNATSTINENKLLKNENIELNKWNKYYKNKLLNNSIKLNIYFLNKWNIIYNNYNILNNILEKKKKQIVGLMKINKL